MPDCAFLPRGVYRAPCLSENRELIVFAVDHTHALLKNGRICVPLGENPLSVADYLWERLNTEDPAPEPTQGFDHGLVA